MKTITITIGAEEVPVLYSIERVDGNQSIFFRYGETFGGIYDGASIWGVDYLHYDPERIDEIFRAILVSEAISSGTQKPAQE